MNQKILHTPEGVRDIYGDECERKQIIEQKLHAVLTSYGYRDIETPTFEFFDVFGSDVGTIPSRDLYKRIASITGQEDYEDMLDELMDRYGEPPRSVQNLLKVALLKSKAHDVYLTELTQKNDELCFVLWQKAPVDPDKVGPFMQRYQRRLRFVAGDKPHFAYILPAGGGGICDVLGEAEHLIDDMQQELLAT